jgi:dTDP-4-amino-4,6-dideoxygalactose transaminase
MCTHREETYACVPQLSPLLESEKAQDHCIILPLFHQMTEADQNTVVSTLREAYNW